MTDLTIEDVDRDGAIAEALDRLPATASRGDFLRTSALALGGVTVWAGLTAADAEAFSRGDTAILQFDLQLERLQAALYTEAERLGAVSRETLSWSRVIGAHERAHVVALAGLLGSKAQPSPSFDFHGVTEDDAAFVKTSVAFEDLTAAVLKSQAVRLQSPQILSALLTLLSVETRHAAWVRRRIGISPVLTAFDEPAPQERIAALVRSTRFVVSGPRTSMRRAPRFTG